MVQDEMLASGRLAIDATLVLVISVSTVFGLQAQDLLVALLLSVHPRSRGLFFCALHGSTGRETGRLLGMALSVLDGWVGREHIKGPILYCSRYRTTHTLATVASDLLLSPLLSLCEVGPGAAH